MSESMSTKDDDWIKLDLHIHTLDDPKDLFATLAAPAASTRVGALQSV